MPTVQNARGYRVTKEWLQRVDNVCATVTAPRENPPNRYLWQTIRVVYLLDDWTLETTAYTTRAQFCDDAARVVRAPTINLYCPLYLGHTGPGRGAPPVGKNQRCWAIFRGTRWEYLGAPQAGGVVYSAGAGLGENWTTDGKEFYNAGVINAYVDGSATDLVESSALKFSKHHFTRQSGTVDGTHVIGLRVRRVRVVSNIVNGAPEYVYLNVIDEAIT